MRAAAVFGALLLAACAGPAKKPADKPASAEQTPRGSFPEPETSFDRAVVLTCKNSQETRVLTSRPQDGGCEVLYERSGETTVAASAKNDPTHCAKVLERIEGNLKKAGFKCSR